MVMENSEMCERKRQLANRELDVDDWFLSQSEVIIRLAASMAGVFKHQTPVLDHLTLAPTG
jgi:hypothetical protein